MQVTLMQAPPSPHVEQPAALFPIGTLLILVGGFRQGRIALRTYRGLLDLSDPHVCSTWDFGPLAKRTPTGPLARRAPTG